MDWSQVNAFYDTMTSVNDAKGDAIDRLWHALLNAASRYAGLRSEWALASADTRVELDKGRTLAHNAFIDCCNALSRAMTAAGLDVTWRQRLGDHRTAEGRKVIGDFACMLHCVLAISAR